MSYKRPYSLIRSMPPSSGASLLKAMISFHVEDGLDSKMLMTFSSCLVVVNLGE